MTRQEEIVKPECSLEELRHCILVCNLSPESHLYRVGLGLISHHVDKLAELGSTAQ